MTTRADILMVTYRSADYVRTSLDRLLASMSDQDRVWLWQNGDDEATLDALSGYRDDPRIERFHHSRVNERLGPPMRWLWCESRARFIAKVDDDCLVDERWLDVFSDAHERNPEFAVIGSWRYPPEDFDLSVAAPKIQEFAGGHTLLRSNWVQGSGFLLDRQWVISKGPIAEDETFTQYCVRLAKAGAVNGWYYPFVREDHMDDPRSSHSLIRSDEDLARRLPLSAQRLGVTTVDDWVAQLRHSARVVQEASLDPHAYGGWGNRVRIARRRARHLLRRPARW